VLDVPTSMVMIALIFSFELTIDSFQ
jgi:hypothetical protein